MNRQTIVPCLWFDDQAEKAAEFYTQLFPGGRVTAVSHYPESADNPGGKARGSVLTVEFEIAGHRFTALNGGPHFVIGPSISFFVVVDDKAEVERIFTALAEGGTEMMPLGTYPWSEGYGWVQDRFLVSWQVMTRQPGQMSSNILPCLMFSGDNQGRAEQAADFYASVFPSGKVETLQRYLAGEGPEGTLKHGRIEIAGQSVIVMDAENQFKFNEAVSLQIICRDQAEIDGYWEALSVKGQKGPCGWLKDQFGVSWQVVPEGIVSWLSSTDTRARDRAFQAMLGMSKPDLAALQAAFEGQTSAA